MYRWLVFLHVASVFGFLVAHGASVAMLFRLRRERDPARVVGLLETSASSIVTFYVTFGAVVATGVVAGFMGRWWAQGWIWTAIAILLITSVAMLGMARPYYRRVGVVARALVGGSEAVSEGQFDSVLRSNRPLTIAAIGFLGLAAILYLMMFQPTFGLGEAPAAPPTGAEVQVSADNIEFSTDRLVAPANRPFQLFFDNREAVPHNVSVYTDSSRSEALFAGEIITGPGTITYEVPALPAGTYFFVCDVHPQQMTGTFIVE